MMIDWRNGTISEEGESLDRHLEKTNNRLVRR